MKKKKILSFSVFNKQIIMQIAVYPQFYRSVIISLRHEYEYTNKFYIRSSIFMD